MNAPDRQTEPVRAAIDSTIMLVLARFFMPVVVAVLGWILSTSLDELRTTNRELWAQLRRLGEVQAGSGAKLDAVSKQVDHLQLQVDTLPRR